MSIDYVFDCGVRGQQDENNPCSTHLYYNACSEAHVGSHDGHVGVECVILTVSFA